MQKLLKSRRKDSLLLCGRRFIRHPKNIPTEITFGADAGTQSCELKNLSRGGACLKLIKTQPLQIGDEVSLKLMLKNHDTALELESKVAWIDTKGGTFGVEFSEPLSDEEAA